MQIYYNLKYYYYNLFNFYKRNNNIEENKFGTKSQIMLPRAFVSFSNE